MYTCNHTNCNGFYNNVTFYLEPVGGIYIKSMFKIVNGSDPNNRYQQDFILRCTNAGSQNWFGQNNNLSHTGAGNSKAIGISMGIGGDILAQTLNRELAPGVNPWDTDQPAFGNYLNALGNPTYRDGLQGDYSMANANINFLKDSNASVVNSGASLSTICDRYTDPEDGITPFGAAFRHSPWRYTTTGGGDASHPGLVTTSMDLYGGGTQYTNFMHFHDESKKFYTHIWQGIAFPASLEPGHDRNTGYAEMGVTLDLGPELDFNWGETIDYSIDWETHPIVIKEKNPTTGYPDFANFGSSKMSMLTTESYQDNCFGTFTNCIVNFTGSFKAMPAFNNQPAIASNPNKVGRYYTGGSFSDTQSQLTCRSLMWAPSTLAGTNTAVTQSEETGGQINAFWQQLLKPAWMTAGTAYMNATFTAGVDPYYIPMMEPGQQVSTSPWGLTSFGNPYSIDERYSSAMHFVWGLVTQSPEAKQNGLAVATSCAGVNTVFATQNFSGTGSFPCVNAFGTPGVGNNGAVSPWNTTQNKIGNVTRIGIPNTSTTDFNSYMHMPGAALAVDTVTSYAFKLYNTSKVFHNEPFKIELTDNGGSIEYSVVSIDAWDSNGNAYTYDVTTHPSNFPIVPGGAQGPPFYLKEQITYPTGGINNHAVVHIEAFQDGSTTSTATLCSFHLVYPWTTGAPNTLAQLKTDYYDRFGVAQGGTLPLGGYERSNLERSLISIQQTAEQGGQGTCAACRNTGGGPGVDMDNWLGMVTFSPTEVDGVDEPTQVVDLANPLSFGQVGTNTSVTKALFYKFDKCLDTQKVIIDGVAQDALGLACDYGCACYGEDFIYFGGTYFNSHVYGCMDCPGNENAGIKLDALNGSFTWLYSSGTGCIPLDLGTQAAYLGQDYLYIRVDVMFSPTAATVWNGTGPYDMFISGILPLFTVDVTCVALEENYECCTEEIAITAMLPDPPIACSEDLAVVYDGRNSPSIVDCSNFYYFEDVIIKTDSFANWTANCIDTESPNLPVPICHITTEDLYTQHLGVSNHQAWNSINISNPITETEDILVHIWLEDNNNCTWYFDPGATYTENTDTSDFQTSTGISDSTFVLKDAATLGHSYINYVLSPGQSIPSTVYYNSWYDGNCGNNLNCHPETYFGGSYWNMFTLYGEVYNTLINPTPLALINAYPNIWAPPATTVVPTINSGGMPVPPAQPIPQIGNSPCQAVLPFTGMAPAWSNGCTLIGAKVTAEICDPFQFAGAISGPHTDQFYIEFCDPATGLCTTPQIGDRFLSNCCTGGPNIGQKTAWEVTSIQGTGPTEGWRTKYEGCTFSLDWWECDNGTCNSVPAGAGTPLPPFYQTQAACDAACVVGVMESWDCIDGSCVKYNDLSGAYPNEFACLNSPECDVSPPGGEGIDCVTVKWAISKVVAGSWEMLDCEPVNEEEEFCCHGEAEMCVPLKCCECTPDCPCEEGQNGQIIPDPTLGGGGTTGGGTGWDIVDNIWSQAGLFGADTLSCCGRPVGNTCFIDQMDNLLYNLINTGEGESAFTGKTCKYETVNDFVHLWTYMLIMDFETYWAQQSALVIALWNDYIAGTTGTVNATLCDVPEISVVTVLGGYGLLGYDYDGDGINDDKKTCIYDYFKCKGVDIQPLLECPGVYSDAMSRADGDLVGGINYEITSWEITGTTDPNDGISEMCIEECLAQPVDQCADPAVLNVFIVQ